MKTITTIAVLFLAFCRPLAGQAAQQGQTSDPKPFLNIAIELSADNDKDYLDYAKALRDALGGRYVNLSNGFEDGFKWNISITPGGWNKVFATLGPTELPEALRYLKLPTFTLIEKAGTPPDAAAAEVTVVMIAIQTSLKNGVVPQLPTPVQR